MISFLSLPAELHLDILTYLRATELSVLSKSCKTFDNKKLILRIINHFASDVYPSELTEGFDTAIVGGDINDSYYSTFESLRNMEMLVVARLLSRPELPISQRENGFYVSRAWCRTALSWLDVQTEKRNKREAVRIAKKQDVVAVTIENTGRKKNHHKPKEKHIGGKKSNRKSKRQERLRNRKSSEVPPWPNVNYDIMCEHGDLICSTVRSTRAKRLVMDKMAWKVLKKLYPDSVQLSMEKGECVHCTLELQEVKKIEEGKKQKEMIERKKPLACPIVRGFYTRSGGVPNNRMVQRIQASSVGRSKSFERQCPLVPGIYHALPRSWCHRWRKYLKNGEGLRPCAPDASACLCACHKLPLLPPHLRAYLHGETSALLDTVTRDEAISSRQDEMNGISNIAMLSSADQSNDGISRSLISSPSRQTLLTLRASGMSEEEIIVQHTAMIDLENNHQQQQQERQEISTTATGSSVSSPEANRANINAQLDRKNKVVVEILTDEEFTALERWWPEIHSSYALRFAILENESKSYEIIWNTPSCRECDSSSLVDNDVVVRNRCRSWAKKNTIRGKI